MKGRKVWTEQEEDRIRFLWGDGWSARMIADKMEGVSRSAVLGKLHRMGLTGMGERRTTLRCASVRRVRTPAEWPAWWLRRKDEAPVESQPSATAIKPVAPPVELPECTLLLSDVPDNGCRYPGAEAGGRHLFCGRDKIPGSSYCQAHHGVCQTARQFVPRRGRRVDEDKLLRARRVMFEGVE